MVGAIEYQAGGPSSNPSVVTLIFLKNAGQIVCVSTHPVTDE